MTTDAAPRVPARRRFRGLSNLVGLLIGLVERPRWLGPKNSDLRGDRPLPLVCLVGQSGAEVLDGLAVGMTGRTRKPPFARVVAEKGAEQPDEPDDRQPVLPLLEQLRQGLRLPVYGSTRRARFRHYHLVDWLTRRSAGKAVQRDETFPTVQALREWHTKGRPSALSPETGGDSLWLRLLTLVPDLFRLARFGLWRTFGEPRWLMRQPFMMPGHSTRFVDFADRLADDRRGRESATQVEKLLVHAFLQDLRAEFRPRRLRPRRWRHTSHVVVLLEGVTQGNGGWKLLRLINDVRNESTEHDPLLVVATAQRKPDDLRPGEAPWRAQEAGAALEAWENGLPVGRQKLSADARFLFLSVPDPGGDGPSDADDAAWRTWDGHQSPKPPVLARRWALVLTFALVVIALVSTVVLPAAQRYGNGCLPLTVGDGVAVRWMDDLDECVGYSDDASQVFGTDERLRRAQRDVFASNRVAEDLHEASGRPLVSLVYFGDLTHAEESPGTDASIAEELEGLHIQQRALNVENYDRPLLRIVVANGGEGMLSARTVVDDLLLPMVDDDPSVLGVVNLGLTTDATESALGALGDHGVPVVATTLTGTVLPSLSPLYFQLVPPNGAQARAVAGYAATLGARRVMVYHPNLSDNYLRTLVEESANALRERGILSTPSSWGDQVGEIVPACGADTMLFYAGRENDFRNFLIKVVTTCGKPGQDQPVVVGDDTVSRFMAQQSVRQDINLAGRPASFVSLAPGVVLAEGKCRPGGTGEAGDQALTAFCEGYSKLPEDKRSGRPWPGERVGLAYDAAGLFVHAVELNQQRRRVPDPLDPPSTTEPPYSPNRGAIAHEMRGFKDYQGATGTIDFTTSATGATRPVGILTVDNVGDDNALPRCAYEYENNAGRSC